MEAARRAICLEDPFNPLITTTMQASGILVISHFFHLVLKPLGQPGPVAQILAGIVLGPSLLSRIRIVKEFFIQSSSADYYEFFQSVSTILFMFLIGLETDIPYMLRNLRKAAIVAYGGVVVCGFFGSSVSVFMIHVLKVSSNQVAFANIMIVLLANAASPAVIRLATELKFATADLGRLVIASSLISEISCILWFSIFVAFTSGEMFGEGIGFLLLVVGIIFLNKYIAGWCNRRNRNQKYVSNAEVLFFLVVVILYALLIEENGYNGTVACYVLGLMFPREGKTTRTLLRKLTYAVHNFILPIYFGYIGFQFDISYLDSYRNVILVVLMIFLSTGGKIIGTLAACRHLKIPTIEGVVLSLFLNLKGHAELLLFQTLKKSILKSWADQKVHGLLIMVVVLNTMIAGPAVAYILRKNEKYFNFKDTSLELHEPDSELRMLSCVYGSRHISAKIGLIWALSGSLRTPITAYLMHLVELPKKQNKNLMYHQLKDGDQYSDEEDYGGNDVLEINDAVDAFTMETKVLIHQRKVVSSFATMYEDVCDGVEDLRVSIIVLTFHKHQRLDGKMESGKEGIRTTNQKLLRHAPCSVGIFVDRGQTGFKQPSSELVQHVATLFFGGPDDREALACSKRIAAHPHVNLTLIRFIPTASGEPKESIIDDTSVGADEVLMAISNQETETEIDNAYMQDFYNRYVATAKVGYVEKYVNNGTETAEALRGMSEAFSLIIVGKGGRGHSAMTTGMSDWEECPELGAVGDLLASSEFNINGSVLVIQQHRHSTNDLRGD